ncbi:hypothetical protein H9L12_08000 [Sphingomonas rhizophila]|uniref:Uncharacterized protein n=1 Tax=Sphingomonas rhizophila TaxID=2071607 RepID=A0A7G9S8W5_9SPHN|nr:hypothetical protein [Sphingomonas rhizophila]QNN64290.1 hypothetical protein H9L12_08000 [Sphingomonas rhizophila]
MALIEHAPNPQSSRYARLAELCRSKAASASSKSMADGMTEMALAYERRSTGDRW